MRAQLTVYNYNVAKCILNFLSASQCPSISNSLHKDTRIYVNGIYGILFSTIAKPKFIIGLNYGLSPRRRYAMIWTNAGILFILPFWTKFSEILIEIHVYIQENAFENVVWEMADIFLGLNVLTGGIGKGNEKFDIPGVIRSLIT